MLTKLTSEKQMKFLCFLCCLAYFMSYLTRINYAACMVELQSALQIGKSIAGLPVTACFLSYGLGQIICGFLGDKMKPQLMIFAGLAGACACNLTVALIPRMEVITPVWCANGFFQAMLWPPMVRIMAECLSDKWYRHCCVLVSMASSAATIASTYSRPCASNCPAGSPSSTSRRPWVWLPPPYGWQIPASSHPAGQCRKGKRPLTAWKIPHPAR